MGRILDSNVRNSLNIFDPVSGSVITLYYRIPTSSERIAFESAQFQTIDGKIKHSAAEARQQFGMLILEGFKKGTFHLLDESGSIKDFSSDQEDPDYLPNWKEKVTELAIDLVEVLGFRIFEGHRIISQQDSSIKSDSKSGVGDERKN